MAGLLITTEAMVAEKPEPKGSGPAGGPPGGDMGGPAWAFRSRGGGCLPPVSFFLYSCPVPCRPRDDGGRGLSLFCVGGGVRGVPHPCEW